MNHQSISELLLQMGANARQASAQMAKASAGQKSRALNILSSLLIEQKTALQATNQVEVAIAIEKGLSEPMVDRLRLTDSSLQTLAKGCQQIAAMDDVIGEITGLTQQPSGIRVGQMRVPLGVFGMIYESRPNVTIEAASLAIKSGNACILRGGSEALDSNKSLVALVHQALSAADLPEDAVQLVPIVDRSAVDALITMQEFVDVLIPRGGRSLIEHVKKHALIPVIKHLDGVCHTYIDAPCDIEMAVRIADNAKTQKYSPCNATETLLVAQDVAQEFLRKIALIYASKNVEMRVTPEIAALLQPLNLSGILLATEADWRSEYLAPIISIAIVDGVESAIKHINDYGSHHSDAIVTSHYGNAQKFIREVDSSSVLVNTSTRFADGFEYGLGAEIGISTDKLHARGPVGVLGLTSLKYVVLGEGEIRQ